MYRGNCYAAGRANWVRPVDQHNAEIDAIKLDTIKAMHETLMLAAINAILDAPAGAKLDSLTLVAEEWTITAESHGGETLAVVITRASPVAKSLARLIRAYFGIPRKDKGGGRRQHDPQPTASAGPGGEP